MDRPDTPEVRFVARLYFAVTLALGVLVVSAPLPVLLDRFVPDDVFYYFTTARNFAASGVSSFDQIHFTNGYQPLWFLLSVPVFLVFPNGGELPFRALLLVQVACSAAAAGLMARTTARIFGATPAVVAGLLWLVVFQRVSVNGLETALQGLLFAVVFAQVMAIAASPSPIRTTDAQRLGLASALLFLARTDAALLIAALGLWLLTRHRITDPIVRAFAMPVAAIAGAYLLVNLWTTGHLMPVSGAAKMYHSSVARTAAATAGDTSSAALAIANLGWPITDRALWLVGSLAAPLVLLATARAGVLGPLAPYVRALWPFALFVWATFAFYAVAFYGGFSRTLWYYGPTLMVGWFAMAGLGAVLARTALWRPVPWAAPFVLASLALRWYSGAQLAAGAAGAPVLARLIGSRSGAPTVVASAAVAATAGFVWWTFATQGIWLSTFITVTAVAALLGSLVPVARLPRLALAHVIAGFLVPAVLVHGKNLAGELTSAPVHWNAHLYRGAIWARDALPPDAVIWSGSAGILGYFSDRRTVNTDGLANSYAFLENVLQARQVGTFVSQFDYAIDAFAGDGLARQFPDGCFVPLPPGAAPPPFQDGTLERQLRVFQMKPTGLVDCAALRLR